MICNFARRVVMPSYGLSMLVVACCGFNPACGTFVASCARHGASCICCLLLHMPHRVLIACSDCVGGMSHVVALSGDVVVRSELDLQPWKREFKPGSHYRVLAAKPVLTKQQQGRTLPRAPSRDSVVGLVDTAREHLLTQLLCGRQMPLLCLDALDLRASDNAQGCKPPLESTNKKQVVTLPLKVHAARHIRPNPRFSHATQCRGLARLSGAAAARASSNVRFCSSTLSYSFCIYARRQTSVCKGSRTRECLAATFRRAYFAEATRCSSSSSRERACSSLSPYFRKLSKTCAGAP